MNFKPGDYVKHVYYKNQLFRIVKFDHFYSSFEHYQIIDESGFIKVMFGPHLTLIEVKVKCPEYLKNS